MLYTLLLRCMLLNDENIAAEYKHQEILILIRMELKFLDANSIILIRRNTHSTYST
jgi:hypothetical protein